MDTAVLEKTIALSEARLDALSAWLFWATLIVVAGLVIEYVPMVWRLARGGEAKPVQRRAAWLELMGGALITLGVGGELVVQFQASREESMARNATDQYIATVSRGTEMVRAANMALEARIQPRRLSPDQQHALAGVFANFPGRSVYVASYELDSDAAVLGLQILHAARDAHLTTEDRRMSRGALEGMAMGVSVAGTDAPLVDATIAALTRFGLKPNRDPPPPDNPAGAGKYGPFPVEIFIGAKPPPA